MRHLHIMAIIILFASCSSCYKNNVHQLRTAVFSSELSTDTTGSHCNQTFGIERKLVNDQFATAVVLATTGSDKVIYLYLDKRDSLLGSGMFTMNIDRDIEEIKTDVFSLLAIEDLKDIEFKKSHELTNYVSFGNFIDAGNDMLTWIGYGGTSHTANGRICAVPYNTKTRLFGNKFRVPRPIDGTGVRGGGASKIDGRIHNFTSLYTSSSNTFGSILHVKSNDLTGTSWQPEDTILFKVGTHGGNKESTYSRFNIYGVPANPRPKEHWVSWFEHNGAGTYRTNYFWSDNDFTTYENFNIPQGVGDRIGEHFFIDAGNNRMIALGRQTTNAPMRQSVCFNTSVFPHVWTPWQPTNLGNGLGQVMGAGLNTPEYGVVIVYGDRGTNDVKISIDNDVETIINNPLAYNTGQTIYTTGSADIFKPLGYSCIIPVSQFGYAIGFSEHMGTTANLIIGYGSLKKYRQ